MFLSDFPALDTTVPIQLEAPSSFTLPEIQVDFGPGYGVQTIAAQTVNAPVSQSLTPDMFNYTTPTLAPSSQPLTPLAPWSPTPAPTTVKPQPPAAPIVMKTAAAPTTPVVSTSPQPQPSTASPQAGDWFTRNVVPVVQAGLTTWAAVNQYNAAQAAAQARLPAGVSASYLPTSGVSTGPLTAAQIAAMTPAQQQQYYAMYPTANPAIYPSTGGILQSMGLGTMDTQTMLLLGGGSLLLLLMLSGGKKRGR